MTIAVSVSRRGPSRHLSPKVHVGSLVGFRKALQLYHFFTNDWHLSGRGVTTLWEILREAKFLSGGKIPLDRILRVYGSCNRDVWADQDPSVRADPRDPNFGEINRSVFDTICEQLGLPKLDW